MRAKQGLTIVVKTRQEPCAGIACLEASLTPTRGILTEPQEIVYRIEYLFVKILASKLLSHPITGTSFSLKSVRNMLLFFVLSLFVLSSAACPRFLPDLGVSRQRQIYKPGYVYDNEEDGWPQDDDSPIRTISYCYGDSGPKPSWTLSSNSQ